MLEEIDRQIILGLILSWLLRCFSLKIDNKKFFNFKLENKL